jgi:hypothetical protein
MTNSTLNSAPAALLGACLACLSACSGKALILDGGPQNTAVTPPDAGAAESTPLHDEIEAFWVDDARLYWATGGDSVPIESQKMQSCLHDDCANTTITYGGTSLYGEAAAIGQTAVFWTKRDSEATVLSCPNAGCTGTPTKVVQDPNLNPTAPFVADGDYFYWTSAFDTYRCPSAGCAEIPEVVVQGETASGMQIVGAYAYWAREASPAVDGGTETTWEIRRVPKDGSAVPATIKTITLTLGITMSWGGFTVDGTRLYWLDDTSHVQSCSLESCEEEAPTALVTTDTVKFGLQVDATNMYWVEHPVSVILDVAMYCPLSGCSAPQVLISDLNFSGTLELDSSYVYWEGTQAVAGGITDDHNIHRIRKPTQ